MKRLVLWVIPVMMILSCQKKQEYYLSQGEIFHTSYHIKYEYKEPLGKQIQVVLDSFDLSLNPFNEKSVISKVNNNQPIEVDDFFVTVFNKAQEVSEVSGGAFDITCAPLVNLWGFGFDKTDSVTPEIIDSIKSFVGYRKVHLVGRKIVKDDPQIILNASAIAKGYSCDVVAELLESYGIKNYMIEIGGEVCAKGKNPNGVCWKIEITRPDDDRSGLKKDRFVVLGLCDRALATSGNYRNFYIKNGKKYAHTIDPFSGYPAENEMLSATVIAPDCMTADAYATAFMTLGLEKACAIGDNIPELVYYFIFSDEEGNLGVKYSSNMEKYIMQ
ncbi:FAD:protein FMN transferase [Bacteroidia bacterium]|nr:FAD:protein FMN transferase [Bacteroidia bacterium]